MWQQMGFYCLKNEILNVSKRECFNVAKRGYVNVGKIEYFNICHTKLITIMSQKISFLTLQGPMSRYIENSQFICRANQMTGFYMTGTLVVKGLIIKKEVV